VLIKAAKRIINSDKMCRSYSELNFGVTFWNSVVVHNYIGNQVSRRRKIITSRERREPASFAGGGATGYSLLSGTCNVVTPLAMRL